VTKVFSKNFSRISMRNDARLKNINKIDVVKDIIVSIGIHTEFGFKPSEYCPLLNELYKISNRLFNEFEPEKLCGKE